MNKDFITIVSGEPRSGTSLMMQTLKALGLPLTGSAKPQEDRLSRFKDDKGEWLPEYLDRKEDIERRLKHSDMMNPVGFYETEYVSSGVRGVDAEQFKGKVMKIITSGIPEQHTPRGVMGTPKKLIDKVVLCVRNPKNIATSQKNLINDTLLVANEQGEWVYHNDAPPSPLAYIGRTGGFVVWLDDNPEFKEKILVVEYEDMHSNPSEQINKVIEFLGIEPTTDQIHDAIANVNPSLRRSESFDEWPENFKEDGELAMHIYDAIESLSDEKITHTSALLREKHLKMRHEHTKWVDDDEFKTWFSMDAGLYRDIAKNKNGLKDRLVKPNNGNNCYLCKHNSNDEETYTVERPEDIGSLTRNFINCKRDQDKRTVEECYQCWTFGWHRNGKAEMPEMKRG